MFFRTQVQVATDVSANLVVAEWHIETTGEVMRKARTIAAEIVRVAFFLTILLAPVLLYRHTFGSHISTKTEDWTAMGTAMAGIYGPLLAVLTLVVLVFQVRLQAESGKHTFDQAHVQQANSDIAFYLEQLETALAVNHPFSGRSIGKYLSDAYAPRTTLDQLRDLHRVAAVVNEDHSKLFAAWSAYQSVVAGLQKVDAQPYIKTLASARQRATTVLTFEMCVSLDNFVWSLSEGSLEGPYLFSPLLRECSTDGGR
jgi:hypothetical protein